MKVLHYLKNPYYRSLVILFLFAVCTILLLFDFGAVSVVAKWILMRAIFWLFIFRFAWFSYKGFLRVKTRETRKGKYEEIAFAVFAAAISVLMAYLAFIL